jgi:hypothetical protein
MAASLIGREVHVCNGGPAESCDQSSVEASSCACGGPTVPRTILAEDLKHFYVSQTGAGVEASEAIGEAPLTCGSGRPLQRFPISEGLRAWAEQAEALAVPNRPGQEPVLPRGDQPPSPGTPASTSPQQGTHMGVTWSFQTSGNREATLTIGGRSIHLHDDGLGGWITHKMVGRWPDPAQLAQDFILFHPDYSPLARARVA